MYQIGKAHKVAREMNSETRWIGAGKVQLQSGETVVYSGLTDDNAPHSKRVALNLSKEAGKSLKEWEPISERIIIARVESK